jgi:hypothetical protein
MNYKRVVIVPYKLGSASAKALQNTLQQQLPVPVLRVSTKSTKYQPRWTDYVINWGCSQEWPWINFHYKNANQDVVNKLNFFEKVTASNKVFKNCQVNIPEWTTDADIAANWETTFLARKVLTGHSGEGIVIHEPGDLLIDAPLYVQYKKKRHEYRVHFFKDNNAYTLIDITQKKKRKGFENVNTKIRNHQNGWVYAREDLYIPDDLKTQALNAAFVSDLNFGAVDLIWNEYEDKCYVLEVNSAPGLVGTTLNAYTNAFVKDITRV